MKEFLKTLVKSIPIAFTKNQQYDKQTKQILKKYLKTDAVCVDVGAHVGEITDLFLKYAPGGRHFAFEPIPFLAKALAEKYEDNPKVEVLNYALSDEKDFVDFTLVSSNPSYSGLKKRKFDRANEQVRTITVETEMLDNVFSSLDVSLIKIDVEGAELGVLKGAKDLLKRAKPLLIFEHGLGAADVYGYGPVEMYDFLSEYEYKIYSLKNWLQQNSPYSKTEFIKTFEENKEYYFVGM